jgi:hypothetical protein
MLQFPADAAQPQRVLLQSRADIAPAVVELLRRARRHVRCLHQDLAPFELSQLATIEALHAFLHAHRDASARLLVDSIDWLDTHAARLKLLQRQFPHAVEMRQAVGDDPVGEDAALVADEQHVLVLMASAHGPGEIWFNNPSRAQSLVTTFDRRWQGGAHNLPVVPLGL